MIGYSEAVVHEQYQDRLRRAERDRLAAELEAEQAKPGLWQRFKAHLAESDDPAPSGGRYLADEAA